ncbi:PaATG1 Serine/threonine-protein kinase encoded by the ATG1 gene [Podospora comata]|uniref:non-specific serine/threonine protein kinase n=1 Tax=Podospora comata TaxID=48703 RepID=A0ABY6SMK3_PODCO|nr:PaATG1 Serine/threonine-protein kinase encoded by the ATG1 gene [Podospora comata]
MADRQLSSASSSRRQKQPTDGAVGQFVIDKEIGKGSFAQVYSGRHKVTGALVAIKSVELSRLNKKLKENLYGEIKILKTLRHPHIVALHDCVESATHINLIMEYCELGDLSLFIKKREKLITHSATRDIARRYPIEHNQGLHEVITRHFLKQLASALKFLREGNFVHRDVKPQNLLLLPSPLFRETHQSAKQILSASYDSLMPAAGLPSLPMLKLADFGFARVLPSTSLAETLCGSPLYMAPEILRYERYDAKADLWSVGTVLYEMATGRPPFRAGNHVELLRKIEAAEDQVKFPRESVVSPELKSLVRALLKRNPVERISFADFFNHTVITGPIPNLHEDDLPKPEPQQVKETVRPEGSLSLSCRDSQRGKAATGVLSSPRPRPSSPLATPIEKPNPLEQVPGPRAGLSYSPAGDGLGITRRPAVQPSTSAPARPVMYVDRSRANSTASQRPPRESIVPDPSQTLASQPRPKSRPTKPLTEEEKAAQDVALERDYIFIDKKGVEVNALADQISMYPQSVPKSGQIVRRATQQGHPTSTTGAVSARNNHLRQESYDKPLSSSPGSTTSAISKAIQDASLRLFGFNVAPHLLSKGQSPPQIYSPFPAYPTPSAPAGLISDGKHTTPVDEDSRVAQCIEDWATRSDVVYGFAEVKYKQLVPLAPSMDYGLGGVPADKMEEEDGLTLEATVSLSEEALVLYVKALSLLAKSMDIASLWWTRKSRSDNSNSIHSAARDSVNSQALALKINRVVQWIRSRFNEVLEKAEIVRLKLIEAQKQLPEDHPSHPSNHQTEVGSVTGAEGVILSPGISAEKLMYDRAVEMSRTAAINEIASEDLPGCEIFYSTAIRMLEAVLDSDDDHLPKRRISTSSRDEKAEAAVREDTSEMSSEDKQSIQKMIQMVKARLANLQKKMLAISRAQQQQQQDIISVRRRSGELAPRSVPV